MVRQLDQIYAGLQTLQSHHPELERAFALLPPRSKPSDLSFYLGKQFSPETKLAQLHSQSTLERLAAIAGFLSEMLAYAQRGHDDDEDNAAEGGEGSPGGADQEPQPLDEDSALDSEQDDRYHSASESDHDAMEDQVQSLSRDASLH